MSNPFDALLFVLSGKQRLRWTVFREIFATLYTDLFKGDQTSQALMDRRRNVVQAFQCLGHIEVVFGDDGGYVYVAQPTLARLPKIGLPEFVLCGGRNLELVEKIVETAKHKHSEIQMEMDPRIPNGPTRVVVKADTTEIVQRLASELGINCQLSPAAWRLAAYSCTLEEYLQSCSWSPEADLNWLRTDFNPYLLYFDKSQLLENRSLSRYQNPGWAVNRYFLWNSGQRAEVNLDWGRYAALSFAGVDGVLAYCRHEQSFWVPTTIPLPLLLNRALGLCSGRPPLLTEERFRWLDSRQRSNYYKYGAVPPDIAALVAQKVGQTLREI